MKIGIIGHFGVGETLLNGQTIKTKNLVDVLEKYGNVKIIKVDSHGWMKHPVSLINGIKSAFQNSEAIIMLPAHNGVQVFAPMLLHYKRKYNKKVFYDVVGGWLPEFLEGRKALSYTLKHFDGIWVETSTMGKMLESQGFVNVSVIPNFKDLQPLKNDELVYPSGAPYRLCTFSRVMKEKGIETAVEVIKKVNERLGYTAYSLDVYGQIWDESKEWFDGLQNKFPDYIQYKGSVDADKSVVVLQDYFALLFPTHFFTEGIPGTIIDAYAAGIPVISAKWESFDDVIDEGKTGIGYVFDNDDAFIDVLLKLENNPQYAIDMKHNCIEKAEKYLPENAIQVLLNSINRAG